MTEHARVGASDDEDQPTRPRVDSGIFARSSTTPTSSATPIDGARVLLCVLGMRDAATERAVGRKLEALAWSSSAREVAVRLVSSSDPEAAARAAFVLARNEGKTALRHVLRQIELAIDRGSIDPLPGRLLGAALAAADRPHAVRLIRTQVSSGSARPEDVEVWRRIAIGIAKGV